MNTVISSSTLRRSLVAAILMLFAVTAFAGVPVITTQPANTTVPAGNTATFTVVATGAAPLSYHWRFNGNPIAGANATLTLPSVSDSQAGAYTVVVTNPGGSVTSAPPAVLTVTHPPVITAQPQSLLVFTGDEAFFSVAVNGATPFSYQWKKDGFDLTGQTNASLDLDPVLDTDAGSYTVAIVNVDGSALSAVANLSVLEPVLLTSQPINAAINTCSALSFTVSTFSPVTLHYQWLFNGNPVGADSTSYAIADVSLGNAGGYEVVVSDPYGNNLPPFAILTVQDPLPVISGCPADITVQTGAGRASCDQVVSWTPPTVSDNCPGVTMVSNHLPGDTFPVGVTTVTYSATDSANQQSICSFTVTVQDNTPPTVVTKNITLPLDAAGQAAITAASVDDGSSDNCGIASMSVSPSAFTCANAGANTVTLTVTDIHGNSASHTATVTVTDVTPPVVVTKNITVQLDGTGHVSITGADVDNGSSDTCGIASRVVTPASFTCANVGPNTVTLTVTDVHGNPASLTATVTVQDLVPPTVLTKDITLHLDASGNASITAADVDNGSTDACGISTMSVSPNTFTCANTGANPVTLTVTDVHGNTATQSATVTVVDTTPPAIVFNTISVQLDASGNYALTPADIETIAAGSTDACGIASKSVSPSALTFCDAGARLVTLTVTDIHGNIATSNATITVNAPVAPPAIVYVDAAYGASCSAVSYPAAGGTGVYYVGFNAFATVQGGANAVSAGGTVNVAGGNYFENITLAKPVHIIGSGSSTIIYPAVSDIGLPNPDSGASLRGSQVIVVVSDNVEIASLTVNGDSPANGPGIDARNGIIQGDPGPFTGFEVHDCLVTNIYLRGIYARSPAAANAFNLHDNVVGNVQGGPQSIAIFNFGGGGVIANNTVSDAGDAISANWSTGTIFQNNTILRSGSGIHTDNNGGSGGVADLIQGNTVRDGTSGAYGVWVFAPYVSVTVSANTVTNVDVALASVGQSAPVTTLFTNNTVLGDVTQSGVGVYVTSSLFGFGSSDVSASFGGNFITNTATAFYLESETGYALHATAFDNSLDGNPIGVQTNDLGGTFAMNASGNWWGVNNPVAVAALVPSGVVDYTPWLDAGTDTSPDAGFQGSFHVLHVGAGSPQFDPIGRIQEGVNMVSGSTVLIEAGAYLENVILSADITLMGSGSGTGASDTIITAATASLPAISINNAGGASPGDRLTIQNLRVTGSSAAGLQINSSSGTHSFFHFENVAAVNNSGNGIALAGVGSISQVEVVNCALDNNGNTGFRIASSLAGFDTLTMTGGELKHNSNFGVSVNPSGTVAQVATGININGTVFVGNGSPATSSSGDISLFGFNGNASIQNVSIAASGFLPFQLTGKGSGSSSAGWLPSGTVLLSNIILSGSPKHQAFYIARYSDVSGITLSGIDLTGYVPPLVSPGFEVPMVLENSSAALLNLADTKFPFVPANHYDLAIWNTGGATATCATVFVGANTPQAKLARVLDSHNAPGAGTVTFPVFAINCPAPIVVEATNVAGNVVTYTVTAVDACDGSPIITSTPPSGSVFPVGVTTVNSLVVDSLGDSNACSFTVTVRDTTPPTISCPANVTVGRLQPTDPYATGTASGTDAGSTFIISYVDNRSGLTNCNSTGDILRTWTATDAAHNTNFCTQTITIVDAVAPMFTAFPSDITITNDPGQCSAIVNFTATAVDLGFSEGFEDTNYASGNVDVQPSVAWNDYNSHLTRVASGTAGINASSGTAYGVIDSTVPAAAGDSTGAFSRLGGYSSVFGTGYRVATDVYMDMNDPAVLSATPSSGYGWDLSAAASDQLGGYLRDFIFHAAAYGPTGIVIGADNNSSDSVLDRGGNLLGLPNHATITTSGWYTFEWNFRATNNALAVEMNVRDAGGNILFGQILSNPSDRIDTVVGGHSYLWFTFLAVDKLPVDNTVLQLNVPVVPTIPSGTAFAVGTTNVTCTITDACGNTTNRTFSVTVNDVEPPVIVPPANIVQANDPGQCSAVVTYPLAVITDNCGVSNVVMSPVSGSVLPVGVTPVTIVATDIHGNTSTNGFTVTINDTEPPVISGLPVILTVHTGPGRTTCDRVASWPAPIVTDNCGVSGVVSIPPSGSLFPVGTTPVTTVATDIHGNTSTQIFNVVVQDTTPPIITGAPSDFTVLTGPGRATCDQIASWPAPAVVDNCSVLSVVATPPSGSTFSVGVTPVTIVATDIHGNVSIVSFHVTVQDTTPPVIVTTPATITLDATGQGAITSADVYNAGATADNCGAVNLISVTPTQFTFCNVGPNVVTVIAADTHGNFATNTAVVTVNPPAAQPAVVFVDASYGTTCGPVTFPNTGGTGLYYVGYNAFATMQAGVDAVAAGGAVNVAAGSYAENVVLHQPLSLIGPNAGINPNTGTRVAEAVLVEPGNDINNDNGIIVLNASPVTIDGFTLDGHNPARPEPVNAAEGIQALNSSGLTVANNIVKDYAIAGLDADGSSGINSAIQVRQNQVLNVPGQSGIGYGFGIIFESNSYGTITSNVVAGARRGIQIDSNYDGPTNAVLITDNQVDAGQIGIWVNNNFANAGGTTVSNNTITSTSASTVLPTNPNYSGIFLASLWSTIGDVTVVSNRISGQFDSGILAWNNAKDITVQGGSIDATDMQRGVLVETLDVPYGEVYTGGQGLLTLQSLPISGASTGVWIDDNGSGGSYPFVKVAVQASTISGNGVGAGIQVSGPLAKAIVNSGNVIGGFATGVQVDGGVALIENNILSGNTAAGISVANGAIVDAGDCGGGNISGLGTGTGLNGSSSGHNDLTSYGYDNSAPWAIIDANTSAQSVVLAQNNNFGANPNINALILDGSDNAGVSSLVLFSQLGSVLAAPPGPLSVQCPGDVPAGATNLAGFTALGGSVSAASATVSYSDSILSPGPHEGTITRTYSITDTCGDTGLFTQTITVEDTIPPAIAAVADIVTPNNPGVCGAVVNFALPATSDNCGVASVVATPASGATFPVGVTLVTVVVTDFHGNTNATTFHVTVNDTELPSIVTPPNIVRANDHGVCGAVVAFGLPAAHDNCGAVTVFTSPPSGANFPVGVTPVQITAIDSHGNVAHSTFTVTVNDTEPPVILCPGDIVQVNDPNQTGAVVNFPLPVAHDNCGSASVTTSPASGSIFPVGATTVSVTATDIHGNVSHCSFTVTINDLPVITSQPTGLTNNAATTATFTVTATGTLPLGYQWIKNGTNILSDGGNISGSTSNVLTLTNVLAADAGAYSVVITNVAGALTSSNAVLVVIDPVINTQPADLTVVNGNAASFTVVAAGTAPLSYQWKQNGVSIVGATAATLTLNPVSDTDAGAYTVVVSCPAGTVTSAVATLTVLDPPVVISQPASLTVNLGQSATFGVSANGRTPFSYQWRKNGVNIGGATSRLFTISHVVDSDAASYSVFISNGDGSTTSLAASLTVIDPPVITSQPVGATNNAGTTVTFSVSAGGTTPFVYQWVKNGTNNLSDSGNISGSHSNVLTLTNVLGADAGSYTVVLGNPAATVTSTAATLTVIDPILTSQPVSVTANLGSLASFTVGAYGTTPLSYQWFQGVNPVPGANAATLTFSGVTDAQAGNYHVSVTNAFGATNSVTVSLTVIDPPVITSQPVSRTNVAGTTATFTVIATGTAPDYQWYKGAALIAGATSPTLTLPNVTSADEASYTVVLSNPAGTVTSSPATLTVNNPLQITSQPVSVTNIAGTTASFTVVVSGTLPYTYQWFKNGITALVDGGNVSGAHTSVLTLTNVLAADAAGYTVVISNVVGSITSSSASLTVIDPVILSQSPTNVSVIDGTTFSLSVTAAGTAPLSYQWFVDGDPLTDGFGITGSTTRILTVTNTTDSDAGTYTVVVSNSVGTVTSAPIVLITHVPLIITEPVSLTVNVGQPASFSVSANGTLPFTYQWSLNGTNINGATNRIFSIAHTLDSDAGSYVVLVSNPDGSEPSHPALLTIVDPPLIVTQPVSRTNIAGTTATFTVIASGPVPLAYQWLKNGVNLADGGNISGSSLSTLTLTNVTLADASAYSVIASDAGGHVIGSVTSSVANLTVYLTAAPTLAGPVYSNGSATVTLTGVPGYVYVIQASPDFSVWTPLQTNTAPYSFTDTNAFNFNYRFYRALYVP